MKPVLLTPLVAGLCLAGVQTVRGAEPLSEQLQNPKAADVKIVGHVLEPASLSPGPEQVENLELPDGFEINVFADDLINPRMLAVAEDGTVYVTRREVGDVLMLRDSDGDGEADQREVVASRPDMHGIAIDGDTMYLVTVKELYRTEIKADGSLGELELLIDDLPDAGQHPNRTLVVGPDEQVYLSVGSTCNACSESNPENATMLQVAPDGSMRTIFASGLRNTIGFGFEPESGELYGMDHGIDWLGDNIQHEELNHIVKGGQYGWPYIYDDGRFNPQDEPPGDVTLEEWAKKSVAPVGLYIPHAAPMQMAFYTGDQFPQAYRGDAFVAMRGSWNRRPPSGYEVVRIVFENGEPARFEPFLTGFLVDQGQDDGGGWGQAARLAGIAQAADGSLLLSDDANGVIYRIAYQGDPAAEPKAGPDGFTNAEGADVRISAGAGKADSPQQASSGLAVDSAGGAGAKLDLSSAAFAEGGPIPEKHGAEGEDISPPLSWSQGPEGTQSYAVVMEDPDAPTDSPFVHWVMYNIPADVTSLSEAVPGRPALEQPKGALQGNNDRGSIGYFGPRPPKDDAAHDYHFQVLALDTKLDLSFGATKAELLRAIEGHVLASGSLIGTFER